MSCEFHIREGALDGAIMGLVAGTLLGFLDCVLVTLFSRNNERPNLTDRLIGGCIQGGILGILLGTFFSFLKGPCMLNMKSGMVDGMLVGMLLGAIYGAVQVYRSEEAVNTQKAAVDIADWSVHVAVVCALVGALIALAKGI